VNIPETRHRLLVLDGRPESLLVATPAGRMILYDRDRPRPYTTDDFPSESVTRMDPILASDSYVYAAARPDVYNPVGCLVRYPIDDLGFASPENLCNLPEDWGKYPEMKLYGGNLVLENGSGADWVLPRPDSSGNMRVFSSIDPSRDIVAFLDIASFNSQTASAQYRITFRKLSTNEPIGHYPRVGTLSPLPVTVVFLSDNTMLYGQIGGVAIIPNWRTAIELYP
jgi:hypothetical protein